MPGHELLAASPPFNSLHAAEAAIDDWVRAYNYSRPHPVLGSAAAMETGEECLTRDLLDEIRISLDSLSDLNPEAGAIHGIPEYVPPTKPAKKPANRKPRNTVFDYPGNKPGASA